LAKECNPQIATPTPLFLGCFLRHFERPAPVFVCAILTPKKKQKHKIGNKKSERYASVAFSFQVFPPPKNIKSPPLRLVTSINHRSLCVCARFWLVTQNAADDHHHHCNITSPIYTIHTLDFSVVSRVPRVTHSPNLRFPGDSFPTIIIGRKAGREKSMRGIRKFTGEVSINNEQGVERLDADLRPMGYTTGLKTLL